MEKREITIEQVNELYQYLQGEVPQQLREKHPPRLSSRMAFKVIYFLQEITGVLPDNIERCKTCGALFDRYEGVGRSQHCYLHDYLD